MALTPRADERKAVERLLESDEFESGDHMARALIHLVADLLAKRDSFGVGAKLPTGELVLSLGPYHTKRDAEKAKREAESAGLVAFTAPLLAPAGTIRPAVARTGRCAGCKHRQELHLSMACAVSRCDCAGYEVKK